MHQTQNGNILLGSFTVNDLLTEKKEKRRIPHNKAHHCRFLKGATNEPADLPLSGPPTQSELNQPIEEQANPRVLDPTQQQPQDEEPPPVLVVSPELPEGTPLTTTTRSGRAVRPTMRYQQSLAQREQGIVAWEMLVDQDEQETIPTAKQQYDLQV